MTQRLRTGLLSLLLLVVSSCPSRAESLFPLGSTWRHLEGASEPADWKSRELADSSWGLGAAPLGYGETYIVTPVSYGPNSGAKWITTYFRIAFTLADTSNITGGLLTADYDDGFVAYLNGAEIARGQMPAGVPVWGTTALLHEAGTPEAFPLSVAASAFRVGLNVLAVEVHQQAGTSSDLVWNAGLTIDRGILTPTRGPYLQTPSPTAMVVRWRTGTAGIGRVRWGLEDGSWTGSASEGAATTEHEVALTGLLPETRYHYTLDDVGGYTLLTDTTRAFHTPPLPGMRRPTRVWIWGDGGLDNVNSRAVRDAYRARAVTRPADVGLMLGDNAYNVGSDAEYQSGCFNLLAPVLTQLPFLSTRGNHEVLTAGPGNDYYDFFTLPASGQSGGVPSGTEAYYSFDWANVHFICLDSEGTDRTLGGSMIQWLRQDLAASQADWTVCYWHHPPYSKGSHDSDNIGDSGGRMRDMRENVLPILDSTGVDVVLAGHSHAYERSFLIRGHYGTSNTFNPSMKAQPGDGRPDGDGVYQKATNGSGPQEGVVYAVAGSSAQLTPPGAHAAMVTQVAAMGSMLIDVDGDRLEARFLDQAGAIRDSFVIVKPTVLTSPPQSRPTSLDFSAPAPNPTGGTTALTFSLPFSGPVELTVLDVEGRRVRQLLAREITAGPHRIEWRGQDTRGRTVPAGVYYALLEWNGEKRLQRVVRLQ